MWERSQQIDGWPLQGKGPGNAAGMRNRALFWRDFGRFMGLATHFGGQMYTGLSIRKSNEIDNFADNFKNLEAGL